MIRHSPLKCTLLFSGCERGSGKGCFFRLPLFPLDLQTNMNIAARMASTIRLLPTIMATHAHPGKRRDRARGGGQLRKVEPIKSGLPEKANDQINLIISLRNKPGRVNSQVSRRYLELQSTVRKQISFVSEENVSKHDEFCGELEQNCGHLSSCPS